MQTACSTDSSSQCSTSTSGRSRGLECCLALHGILGRSLPGSRRNTHPTRSQPANRSPSASPLQFEAYDGTNFIHHQFAKIANVATLFFNFYHHQNFNSLLAVVPKQNLARKYFLSEFPSSTQLSRCISRTQGKEEIDN